MSFELILEEMERVLAGKEVDKNFQAKGMSKTIKV